MTQPIDTAHIRELVAKATPGPWNHLGYAGQDGTIQGPRQAVIASLSSALGKSNQTGHQCYINAALIVHLRNNALAMCDEIDRLRAALQEPEQSREGQDG